MSPWKINKFFEKSRERLKLELLNPKLELTGTIQESGISRPGLALSGFFKEFNAKKVQVCGASEVSFLKHLKAGEMKMKMGKLFKYKIPCFIFSGGRQAPPAFVNVAQHAGVPILVSNLSTEQVILQLTDVMNEFFAPRQIVHGSLVDIHGVGILLTGKSGIGKSEIALELLERGHRLVGDDAVTLCRRSEGMLVGQGSELLKHYLELRGIGIVDIRSIFGLKAVRQEKRVEVEVKLERWNRKRNYERVGLETQKISYMGVSIPLTILPIFPGKSITVILEVIALNYILYQSYGYRPAEKLNERLINLMKERAR